MAKVGQTAQMLDLDGVILSHYHVTSKERSGTDCDTWGHFLHGNGFPVATYGPMLDVLRPGVDIFAQDAPGHGASPATDEFLGWNTVSELFEKVIQQHRQQVAIGRAVGIGHSFGGVMTLLMAARRPELFERLILLDPALYPPDFIWQLRGAQLRGEQARVPIVRQTLRRRSHWPDQQSAFASLHHRGVFKEWDERCFQAYVEHGTRMDASGCTLRYPPTLEAALFASFAEGLWQAVRDLTVPTVIVAGKDTYPHFKQAYDLALTQNENISMQLVEGDHCFMMEYPEQTGVLINQLLA